jgi:DNA polymerase (family 10)
VEIIDELVFVVQTTAFPELIERVRRYGGGTQLVESGSKSAVFALPSGPLLRLDLANEQSWGLALIKCTGSKAHLRELSKVTGSLHYRSNVRFPTEESFYGKFGMAFIEPELREGLDEVSKARENDLPRLISQDEILGDLHSHTTASDGSHSIEQMAIAAQKRGYQYLGITDHSQSLRIAGGLSEEALWKQIKSIDKLNKRLSGIRVLKSAEVDILADGTLDYPDELLRELDYTVCSIHSRFALDKEQQTERILRAMDNRYFTILGHATGRLLLKRPGYGLDIERVISHAKQSGCFFEINSSPDRLDLSAENARQASACGVMIAISTDAHSVSEFDTIRYGIEQARRAGMNAAAVLNCQPLTSIIKLFKR